MSKRINSELLAIAKEEKAKRAAELVIANKEKAKRAAELVIANKEKAKLAAELVIAKKEKAKRAAELVIANKEKAKREEELVIAQAEKAKRAAELIIANTGKAKLAAELVIANAMKAKLAAELLIDNIEKEKHAAKLIDADKELTYQHEEKIKVAAKLVIADINKTKLEAELAIAKIDKAKRAAELFIANKEVVYQKGEKTKRAAELIVADAEKSKRESELINAKIEKAKRAAELLIANVEKTKRSAELVIANKELIYQKSEKAKRATELLIANVEKAKHAADLVIANIEKAKRKAQYVVMDKELKLAKEKEKLVAELTIVNKELCLQITERKKAEEELHESQLNYKMLIDLAPDAFFQGDSKGNFILCNKAAIELTGYSLAEMQKMKISDLFPPAQLNENPLRYDLLDAGQSITLEREIIRKDGQIVSVEMNSTKMQDGTYQSFFRDITERKKAEEVLRQSENRFKKLASFTFEGIIIHNNLIAIDVNQSTIKLLGYKKDEIIGMNLFSLIHPDYHAIVKNNINKQVASPYHIVAIKKDGTAFDAEIEARNIAYNNEDFRVVCIRDITKRKKAEDELRKLKENLETEVQEKTKELKERISELERFQEATIEREFRIKELRDEIEKLKANNK